MLASFELGGGETVALLLARAQRMAGHRVGVVALVPEPPVLRARFADAGVELLDCARRGTRGVDPTLWPRLWWRMRRGVGGSRGGLDIVHTHNPLALLYGAAAARAAGARVVHTKHGVGSDSGRRLALRRMSGRFVDAFVAVSRDTARAALEADEPPLGRLRVIENGIDLQAFAGDGATREKLRAELGIDRRAFVLLAVGRIEPIKRHAELASALAPMLGQQLQLAICGDGSLAGRLREVVQASGASRYVHLLGQRSDVAAVLAASDALVISSSSEGLPLTLLEAMAAGLPVISTRVGGIPRAVVDGESGLLVEPDDWDALGAAARELAEDRARARAMGRAGRALARERYSVERMAAAYQRLYASLL